MRFWPLFWPLKTFLRRFLGPIMACMEPFLGQWGHFGGHFRLFWAMVGLFGAQHDPRRLKQPQNAPKCPKMPQNDPKWPKMTPKWPQNDPKMTPKWPQNDQKSIFSKMFLHHFWPFLGWFGVILGCFERVLVIFGPRNAFKWHHIWALKWPKNEPKIDFSKNGSHDCWAFWG